ncbi:S1C family serine protease [Aporhodopirellula aestuarii]|uniref:PDZ domain-containing protein n=1 Tax=Aporhodopirellula aestuarii TaxID=2950107 RepID=A0ABT0U9L1_9BACT|nr:PDZ domain-containing protein [Aporhodopirellula aestuarii]MCM2373669.1 PDZ domain-containing protein [Aporhodopirellula aestuarii]
MAIQRQLTHRRLRTGLSTAVATTAICVFTTGSVLAQDSVRDRLSPGNGADQAGESQTDDNHSGDELNSPSNELNNPAANLNNPADDLNNPSDDLNRAGDRLNDASQNLTEADRTSATVSGQSSINRPGPDQVWYRGDDGRFFYRDSEGNQVFEEQVYGAPNQSQAGWNANQRPVLGIVLSETPNGLQVVGVQPGSAAEQAGIRMGDRIDRFNDQPATRSDEFARRISEMNPGDQLALDVTRNGQPQRLSATLGTAPQFDNRFRAARPTWNDDFGRNSGNMPRFQQDLDDLRQRIDTLSRRFETFSAGSGEKQQATE